MITLAAVGIKLKINTVIDFIECGNTFYFPVLERFVQEEKINYGRLFYRRAEVLVDIILSGNKQAKRYCKGVRQLTDDRSNQKIRKTRLLHPSLDGLAMTKA